MISKINQKYQYKILNYPVTNDNLLVCKIYETIACQRKQKKVVQNLFVLDQMSIIPQIPFDLFDQSERWVRLPAIRKHGLMNLWPPTVLYYFFNWSC